MKTNDIMGSDLVLQWGVDLHIFEGGFIRKVFEGLDVGEETKRDYLFRIPRFVEFVRGRGSLDRNSLTDFKRSLLSDDQIKTSTKSKFLLVAKIFVRELYRLNVLKIDLTAGVRGFRTPSVRKVNGLTENEVQRILGGLNRQQDVRLKPIVFLKMFAGLRDCEVVRLKVEHLQLEDSVILVDGKGRDGNLEPLNIIPPVRQVLTDYLVQTGKKSGPLFTSLSKNNPQGQVTTQTVWNMVRGFLTGLGIKRVPHSFRGFFITELVKRLSNVFEVQYYSRHKSIGSVQFYFNMVERNSNLPRFMTSFDSILQGT